jgi:cytochrome P450
MDVIQELAYPLPTIVISELLGVPRADHVQLKDWVDAFVIAAGKGEHLPSSGSAMVTYFEQLTEQRKRQPENDLISRLVTARADGQQLSIEDVAGICRLLFIAGYETTTYLLGNSVQCFLQHPEVIEQLRSQPTLLPDAIEEVLRYHSPVHLQYRIVARDTEMGGQKLSEGQFILPWIGSSGHDETVFEQPERFDIYRKPNKHIAFGHGIHFCLGAPLARLEAQIALQALLERLPALRLVEGAPLERVQSLVVHGVKNLPVTF